MKSKKSKPIKCTVSFEKRTPTQDEAVNVILSLARLACDSGVEKRLKERHFNSIEEKIRAELEEKEITEKFISDLEKELRKIK